MSELPRTREQWQGMKPETDVLRHLADAIDALHAAASATGSSMVAGYCINAHREINKALMCVIDGEPIP